MGMTTLIYGSILEYGLNQSRLKEIYSHNEGVISNLKIGDSYPPLSREMFSITKTNKLGTGPDLEYWGRMIHFAACTKSVENEWAEWKVKFENLLTQLYWIQAFVHLKTEYAGIVTFKWRVDLKKWSIDEGSTNPISNEVWTFEDKDKWEN